MDAMILVLLLLLVLIAFDLAAWLWGVNSVDRFESSEWRKRQEWRSSNGHG